MTANVWINEIDYDQPGADHDEFLELAGNAGTSLVGWKIVLYNGSTGLQYGTDVALDPFVIPDKGLGMGTVAVTFAAGGLQNGNPDGIALVDDNGNVVQFLSYGGAFTASGGAADGKQSSDIGPVDSSSVDGSVQLTGSGSSYADFTWTFATAASAGEVNTGQTLNHANIPATFSGDTTGSVEEYVTSTAAGRLVVTDADSSSDIVAVTNAQSDNGHGIYAVDASGDWRFAVNPDDAAVLALDTGETLTDFLSIETADGTTTKIEITIHGITDISGTNGNDKSPPVVGTDVRELINTLNGNDEVFGQGGADIIIGGSGADILHGGKGGDSFVYDEKACAIGKKTMDLIADFSSKQHDVIDLTAIDAKPSTPADDTLHLLTNKSQATTKLGSVWLDKGDGHDIVYINNDAGHAGFDMAIDVHTKTHLAAGDFLF